jgi:hypothetical protein
MEQTQCNGGVQWWCDFVKVSAKNDSGMTTVQLRKIPLLPLLFGDRLPPCISKVSDNLLVLMN